MDARNVKTVADARALVEERTPSHVQLGVVDLDDVIRGKYLSDVAWTFSMTAIS
jgi:glutamine synthetase